MNKSELIQAAAAKSGQTITQTTKALDAIIEAMKEALAQDEDVKLMGFGTFNVRSRVARTGVNPGTKQRITIPAKKVVCFREAKKG